MIAVFVLALIAIYWAIGPEHIPAPPPIVPPTPVAAPKKIRRRK